MTPNQRKLARHALGLPNEQRHSYRNRFHATTGSSDWQAWMQMAGNGEAKYSLSPKGSLTDLFWLTKDGAVKALEPGEKLDPEDFPNV